jgi:hypothetical protein
MLPRIKALGYNTIQMCVSSLFPSLLLLLLIHWLTNSCSD